MKNIIIITPVYNDWESFTKLIDEINKIISKFSEISFKLIAVNDGSENKVHTLKLPSNLKMIEVLNTLEELDDVQNVFTNANLI